jgi:hypothetical protein
LLLLAFFSVAIPETARAHFYGDFVWHDVNGNGIQDAGEPGLADVRVEIRLCQDTATLVVEGVPVGFVRDQLIESAVTDSSGKFLFDLHSAGPITCYLKFIVPSGMAVTAPNQGADDTKDSDVDPATKQTPCVTVDCAGAIPPASCYQYQWDLGLTGTAANQPPVVVVSAAPLAYLENAAATAVDAALTVGDADTPHLAGGSVRVTSGFQALEDVIQFTPQAGIVSAYNAATGELTLSGEAPIAAYQTLLRSVTYRNSSDNPSATPRVFTFMVDDGTTTVTATRTVNVLPVNDAPTLNAIADLAIQQDAPLQNVALSGISTGGGEIQTLAITALSDNVLLIPNPVVTYTSPNATGNLAYTPVLGGSGSALITVTVTDSGTTANGGVKTLVRSFRVYMTAPSLPPTVTTSAGTVTFAENAAALVVDPGVTVADPDSTDLILARVRIDTGFQSGADVLAATLPAGIAGFYDATTGTLTLSGLATLATYQTALRSVTYRNTSDNPSTTARSISLFASDGYSGASAARTVNVTASNDAPALTLTPGPGTYIEKADKMSIDGGLVITDADSTTLVSASVRITTGWHYSDDKLDWTVQPGISGGYNPSTGILTLTGSASLSAYQAALRSVSYYNYSCDSRNLARTIQFEIADASATVTLNKALTLVPVNNPPSLNPISDPAPILEDAGLQTMNVSGIGTGCGEAQTLALTAVASDPTLIHHIEVAYTSPGSSGTVRYESEPNANGTATITVTVKDSGGVANGGIDSVSRTFRVAVLPVNRAPTIDPIPELAPILEDAALQTVELTGISPGPGEVQQLTITATSNNPGVIPHPAVNYASGAAVGSLTFAPQPGASGTALITLTLRDDGGTGGAGVDTTVRTFNVTVLAVEDVPTIGLASSMLRYTATEPPIAIDPAVAVDELDTGTLVSAQVAITSGFHSGADVLGFEPQPGIAGAYDPGTGVLAFIGAASADAYESMLRTVTFWNPLSSPQLGLRTIEVTVADGVGSTTAARQVQVLPVNVAPTLDPIADIAALREDSGLQVIAISGISAGGGHSQALVVAASSSNPALIPDPAVIYVSPETTGRLEFTPVANRWGSAVITVTVSDDGGTQAGGVDSFVRQFVVTVLPVNDPPSFNKGADQTIIEDAQPQVVPGWATALTPGPHEGGQLLVFSASAVDPTLFASAPVIDAAGTLRYATAADRSGSTLVHVTLQDDGGVAHGGVDVSTIQSFTISITAVNDPSSVSVSPGAAEFTEGGVAVAIDPGMTITDVDSTQLTSATVAILTGFQTGGDQLGFTPMPGIIGAYDGATGVLNFSGSASLAAYGTLLRTVIFRNPTDNPGSTPRTIAFSAIESGVAGVGNRVVQVIPVNDAPQLTTSAGVVLYNAGAPGSPIDPGVVVSDADSPTLVGAAVRIAAGFQVSADTLRFDNQNGITGGFDPVAGVLTLAGARSLADYQVALRSVRFENLSPTPAGLVRQIEFEVNDGSSTASGLRALELNIGPALTLSPGSTRYTRTGPPTPIDAGLIVSDPNSANLPGATARLIQGTDINDALAFTLRPGITGRFEQGLWVIRFEGLASVADYQAVLRSVTFWNSSRDPGNHPRIIELGVSDGLATVTATRTIRMAGVNIAPTLNTIANPAPVLEDAAPQSVTLAGIGGGGGEEQVLTVTATSSDPALVPHPSVLYTSPAATGTLTWTPTPNASGSATITVRVMDDGGTALGGVDTTTRTFTVTVLPVNDAPTFSAGGPVAVAQNAGAQVIPNWATEISPGPFGESGQTVAFLVSSAGAGLFASPPVLSPAGALSFTPAAGARGAASVSVRLQDNGGTADGGADTSSPKTFAIEVGSSIDLDLDGAPDDWERVHGFDADDGTDGGSDYDGDGCSNTQEFYAGTNPLDPADAPAIVATEPRVGDVVVRFRAVAGRVYRVRRSTAPEGSEWVTIVEQFEAEASGVSEITDGGAAGSQQYFYRVEVVP